jgi:hypothetical protein
LADATLHWKAPLSACRYQEPRDTTFWTTIGHPALAERAARWWPSRGGPSWDAIALASRDDDSAATLVLVEAKANVPEFTSGARGATNPESVRTIDIAPDHARAQLGATGSLDAWAGPNYQLANRLTSALFLQEHGVNTVFAHVLFSDDHSQ